MVGALFTFLYAMLAFDAPRRLFRDSDTGWHIRTGERILDEGALPRRDPYSWSRPGGQWFAWEWGADVLMGAAHRVAGMAGVGWLYLVAIGACSWLWFRLQWAFEGDFLVACVMASPMLSTVNMHWLARPHIFGWVLLLGWLWWVQGRHGRFRIRDGLLVGALSVVWTNVHASFFLMPAVALLFAAGRRCGWCLAAAMVAAGASLVNPYGWQLHEHVFEYLTNRELVAQIGEFQSFNFHAPGALQVVATVGLAAAGATLALSQRQWAEAMLLGIFFVVALRSARALPLLALLLPVANGAITRAWRASTDGWLAGWLAYSGNLRRLERDFGGYGWAAVAVVAGAMFLTSPAVAARSGFPPEEFPVVAAGKLPPQARLFAPDKFGGYLIYHFGGERKVFFDGRSDYYGVEFMKRYIDMVQVRPGWQRAWEEWGFSHALLPPRYSLVDVLPRLGWRETYRDTTAVLLEAPHKTRGGSR